MMLICHHCRFTTDVAVGEPIETGRHEAQQKGWDFRQIAWSSKGPQARYSVPECDLVDVSYCPHCALLVPA